MRREMLSPLLKKCFNLLICLVKYNITPPTPQFNVSAMVFKLLNFNEISKTDKKFQSYVCLQCEAHVTLVALILRSPAAAPACGTLVMVGQPVVSASLT